MKLTCLRCGGSSPVFDDSLEIVSWKCPACMVTNTHIINIDPDPHSADETEKSSNEDDLVLEDGVYYRDFDSLIKDPE